MPSLADVTLHRVDSWDDAQQLLAWLSDDRGREWLAYDCETTGTNVKLNKIRFMQFGDERQGWGMDWERWKGLAEEVFSRVRQNPSGAGQGLVGHNSAVFDNALLKNAGVHLPQSICHDTMVMAALVDNLAPKGLKPAAARWVSKESRVGQDALKQTFKNTGWGWADIPTDHPAYWIYSCMDTALTAHLAAALYPRVKRMGSLPSYEVEVGAAAVLRDAQLRGMRVDLDYCGMQIGLLEPEVEMLGNVLRSLGVEKPGSDAQVIRAFERLGITFTKKTRASRTALDKEVLDELMGFSIRQRIGGGDASDAGKLPLDEGVLSAAGQGHTGALAAVVKRYRLAERLCGSYFRNFFVMNQDSIIYPSINILAARTGRQSVTSPALQTLPRGRVVRDAFIAREGCKMLSADYSGMEYRIMASIASEEHMLEAFREGVDLHTHTASLAYGIDLSEVTKPQRQVAKNASFARLYGAGISKFASTAGISEADAEVFMHRYDKAFPDIDKFMQEMIHQIHSTSRNGAGRRGCGYVTGVLGRRWYVEASEAYKATNYIDQGGAALVLKQKLCELDAAGLGGNILLTVHDEVLFEAPDEDVEDVSRVIQAVMPETRLFDIPLTIEMGVADRWGAVK